MNCHETQDLLLADYTDAQVSPGTKKQVEDHLLDCASCREFFQAVRLTGVDPLLQTSEVKPPEAVWHNIKTQIEDERFSRGGLFNGMREWLDALFKRPVPALAVAAFVVCLVAVTFLLKKPSGENMAQKVSPSEQAEFLVSVLSEIDYAVTDANEGYGTVIEEYFL